MSSLLTYRCYPLTVCSHILVKEQHRLSIAFRHWHSLHSRVSEKKICMENAVGLIMQVLWMTSAILCCSCST